MSDIDQHAESESLRQRVAELEQTLAAAAPRLAAFKRLEEIAASKRTSPEAVAAEAAREVLERERLELEEEIDTTTLRRDGVRRELAAAMAELESHRRDHDEVSARHDEVLSELSELLGEMESIRADAVRLVGEREHLNGELQDLRRAVEELRAEREVELEARDRASTEREIAERERDAVIAEAVAAARSAASEIAVDRPAPAEIDSPTDGSPADGDRRAQPSGEFEDFDDESEDSEAFDRFFSDEEAKDGKARDWMLGSAG